MQIHVNGHPAEIPDDSTVASVLAARNLAPNKVAIELNKRLVRTPDYARPLAAGDQLEIVTFVGGG